MGKNHTKILLAIMVLLLAGLACEGSFSTANISEAWMSFDQEGDRRTTTYGPSDIFYAQVDLQNAPDDTSVKVVWIAEDVEDTEPDFEMNEYEYIGGDSGLYFELENTDFLWPNGKYRADIYLNGDLAQSLTFYVEE
jgi:hypothetical protein